MLWLSATLLVLAALLTAVLAARDPLLKSSSTRRIDRWAVAGLWLAFAPASLIGLWIKGVETADWPDICLMLVVIYLGSSLFTWGRPVILMERLFTDGDSGDLTPALRRRGSRALLLTVLLLVAVIFIRVSTGPPDP
jgi:hypothetical protein